MLLFPETIQAPGSCQGRSSLRIGEDARRCGEGTAPKLGGQL
jgi:hypothetical protein